MLIDFTVYDKNGNYVPQRGVKAVFPKGGSAFGSMKDLIRSGLEEDAEIEGRRNRDLNKIVDEIQRTLPKTEAEISEEQVAQADRDLEDIEMFSLRGIGKDGLYSDANRRRYWYPNMTRTEIAEVKDLTEYEAKTTDNYLGIDAKWLYNNKKGHRYFALYSTADEQGTTLLYACKNDSAEYEYNLLKSIIELREILHGSIDTGSEAIDEILNRTERISSGHHTDRGGVGRAGSNSGNADVYRRNKRKRSSAAFRNCFKNISEVQSRYGVNDHYLFAVDRGDLKTAQKMVDEAAAKAFGKSVLRDKSGKLIKLYHGSAERFNVFRGKQISGIGNYFSPWKSVAEGYGEVRPYYVNLTNPTLYDYDWNPLNDTREENADGIIYVLEDIENGVDPNRSGDTEVIVFNSNNIKSAEPVTYDDNGNVIPLSERFNLNVEDTRYSLRNQHPTTRDILTQVDLSTRSKAEQYHLGKYQEQLELLEDLEIRLAAANEKVDAIPADDKSRRKERLALLQEARVLKAEVNRLKRLTRAAEQSDMMRKIVAEEKRKAQKEEAKKNASIYDRLFSSTVIYTTTSRPLFSSSSVISIFKISRSSMAMPAPKALLWGSVVWAAQRA